MVAAAASGTARRSTGIGTNHGRWTTSTAGGGGWMWNVSQSGGRQGNEWTRMVRAGSRRWLVLWYGGGRLRAGGRHRGRCRWWWNIGRGGGGGIVATRGWSSRRGGPVLRMPLGLVSLHPFSIVIGGSGLDRLRIFLQGIFVQGVFVSHRFRGLRRLLQATLTTRATTHAQNSNHDDDTDTDAFVLCGGGCGLENESIAFHLFCVCIGVSFAKEQPYRE